MSSHHWPRFLPTWWVFTLYVVWNKSTRCSTAQSWAFLTPEWTVQVIAWSPRTSQKIFLQPQTESDSSDSVGICTPTQMTKKVCQRLTDQTSSQWWGQITPRKPRDVYHKILFGTSSSWDSRVSISVHKTESSKVVTMYCYRLPVSDDFLGDPVLSRDDRNWGIGNILSP